MKQDGFTEIPKLPGARVLIVEARFYDALIDELASGARAVLDAAETEYEIVVVPGALDYLDPGARNPFGRVRRGGERHRAP